ncbi:MAG: hypothetical protein COT88_01775 [Candidatus Colwellbacteria bacterium CG10_big_fil_rev_8_21_14_0_10_41_28]|uniref:Uncharacterized protein n=1 Tax=Candidatus Colwellbacteria bacterium CG10_big_fil_rev_8_21_14_0_10_41_28 TaxID=1974539 RepID=A0A2H0VH56_9BACT|nr:MAG: hypothetical protein COT88_01775 [Candidatus Colwellbacteria bacterium CG10_big_fil_rev_8_21_14_0_10_41_28]
MNGTNNQPGVGSPNPNMGNQQDPQQNKVNPMSPNFMGAQDSSVPFPPAGATPPANPGGVMPPTPPMPPAPQAPPVSPSPVPPPPLAPSVPTPPSSLGGAVPPPPSRDVGVRTMDSDQSSIKQTGGLTAQPKTINTGQPATDMPMAETSVTDDGKKKALLLGLGVVILLAIAGAVAYFYVLPNFFSEAPQEDIFAQSGDTFVDDQVPEDPTGVTSPAGLLPPGSTSPANASYESYFNTVAEAESVSVDAVSVGSIKTAVSGISGSAGTISEFYLANSDGEMVTAQEFIAAVLPNFDASKLEESFTGYVYHAATSDWPGYVFKLASDVSDKGSTKTSISADFEASADVENLYTEDIVGPEGTAFANSITVSTGETARYLLFNETTGVSFVYGWSGNYLVLGTHFDGFKSVLNQLAEEAEILE